MEYRIWALFLTTPIHGKLAPEMKARSTAARGGSKHRSAPSGTIRRVSTPVTLAPLRHGAPAAATDALERLASEAGHWPVAGIDEAGRGAPAGAGGGGGGGGAARGLPAGGGVFQKHPWAAP